MSAAAEAAPALVDQTGGMPRLWFVSRDELPLYVEAWQREPDYQLVTVSRRLGERAQYFAFVRLDVMQPVQEVSAALAQQGLPTVPVATCYSSYEQYMQYSGSPSQGLLAA